MKKILFILVGIVIVSGCVKEDKEDIAPSAGEGQESSMEKTMEAPLEVSNEGSMQEEDPKMYTLEEVAKHDTQEDCWTVIDGKVADVTSFFGVHPGGDDNLAKSCGKDATKMFESVKKHDPKGYEKLQDFIIGSL